MKPPKFDRTFQGNVFTLSERDDMTPLEYFKLFWDDEITKNLLEQTNIFSIQVSFKCINTNIKEMEQFLDLQMLMLLIRLPTYGIYWVNEFRFDKIAKHYEFKTV